MSRNYRLILVLLTCVLAGYFFSPSSQSQSSNHSVLFNGTTSNVDVPYNANLNITGALTMEAWVKTNSSAYQIVLERGDWSQAEMSYDLMIGDGKIRMDIKQSSGSYVALIGNTSLGTNAWHHIAGVFDGSQMRVYLDGVVDGTQSSTFTPGSNVRGLKIGRSTNIYYPFPFDGRIDEVRVSSGAIYTSNFTPGAHLSARSSTKGLWKFDGQTTNDFSSSGANGSLQGSATYSTDVPTGPNNAPSVSITDPLNSTTFPAGSNIVIDASASDSDGSISQVEFFQGTTLLGTDSTFPYTFVWTNVTAGSYAITARATDDLGATTTTSALTVTVTQSGNHSVLFNGTTSNVDVPYNANLNITGALTMEAWVKTNSTAYQIVLERGDWSQAEMSYDLMIGDGKIRMDIKQSSGSYIALIGNTSLGTNAWHHIAGVFDGSQMRVYLDGVVDGTQSSTFTPGSNVRGLKIGRSTNIYYPFPFDGKIDEVRVSNDAIYTSNFTPGAHLSATSSTKGLWKFDGQTTNDFSSSGANGSLQGGATYSTDVPSGSSGGSQSPSPNANGPYSGQLGQSITFSSAGSFDPDGTISAYHWNFGDGTFANSANPSHTYSSSGLFTATLTTTDNSGLLSSATATVTVSGNSSAGVDPRNQTGGGGENPLSGNYNWNLPLVSLPGRTGLNLNLSLSYNSLVWTKNGSFISFDNDNGFPGPGFHLGFPSIQGAYLNSQTNQWPYLFIGSDGSHTELRQIAANSQYYESAESSHLLLDTGHISNQTDPYILLQTTEGIVLKYKVQATGLFECTEIKDRNGNYLTVNYNPPNVSPAGRIANIHDTLDRVITFNYNAGLLTSITQNWKNPQNSQPITHTWASFSYDDVTLNYGFSGLTAVAPANPTFKALKTVTLDDNSATPSQNSHFDFSYTSYGQIWKISNFAADNHLLNYRSYDLPLTANSSLTQAPRFYTRRDWAEKWNQNGSGVEQEAVTVYSELSDGCANVPGENSRAANVVQVTQPDGTFSRIYYLGTEGTATGWQFGLPYLVESYDAGGTVPVRQAVSKWEQDNENLSYVLNPRVKETNIYDPSGNRKRATISYQAFTPTIGSVYRLPSDVVEYAKDASTAIRTTHTDYVDGDPDLKAPYQSRRIFGLTKEQKLYDDGVSPRALLSRVGFSYDDTGSIQGTDTPTQHDNTNFSANLVSGRANPTTTKRYDVVSGLLISSTTKYNTAGSVVSAKDALNHEVKFDYTDSFWNETSHNTLAYPTKVIDPDGYYSTTQYNFDFGAVTSRKTPPPNYTGASTSQPAGPEQTFEYYDFGRLKKQINGVNSAYTSYEYVSNGIRMNVNSTIQEGKGEAHSFTITDGAGRVIASALDNPTNPGSTGAYRAQRFIYDVMGRKIKISNPAETAATGNDPSQWTTTDHDETSDWIYTQQTYDWKGRPLVTTNVDNTTKTAEYTGCGCAGGEVVSLMDEGTTVSGTNKRRLQKVFSDVLGRTIKTEMWDFDGTGPGNSGRRLATSIVTTYDARDQVTLVRQFDGAAPEPDQDDLSCPTGTCQKTTFTYDDYGRLQNRHVPEQNTNAVTTWTYNSDGSVNTITDARGAVTTYGYNNSRRLVTSLKHELAGSNTINNTYTYDAAGNRLSMSHSITTPNSIVIPQDNLTFVYDQLSRITSETRHINSLESNTTTQGDYTIGYDYTLAGNLKSVTDPFNSVTNFDYDATGRTTGVTGSYGGSNYTYVSNVGYRAWGGRKSNSDGSITYNTRLLPVSNGSYTYNYNNDGTLKELLDPADNMSNPFQVARYMSRLYSYDYAGRIKSVDGAPSSTYGVAPFVGHYGYDAFGNLASRWGHYALYNNQSDSGTFLNNRRTDTGWAYDVDGRLTSSKDVNSGSTQTWAYDAGGNQITVAETLSGSTSTNTLRYDGDGELLFESVVKPGQTVSDYLIRSTVLGEVLTKLDANGNKDTTYVPTNGLAFPLQLKDSNGNPTVTYLTRDITGLMESGKTYDPFGALIANSSPPSGGGPPAGPPVWGSGYNGSSSSAFTDANNFATGCTLDGVRTACSSVMNALGHGMATGVISYNGSAASVANSLGFMPMNHTTTRFVGAGNKTYFDRNGNAYPAYGSGHYETTVSTEFVPIFGYDVAAPPDPQGPPQPSGCAKFVDKLISFVDRNGVSITQRAMGVAMAYDAKYHSGALAAKGELDFSGFKPELIAGEQNGWAMVHIQGIAGASLAGAQDEVDRQFQEDKNQLALGLQYQRANRTSIPYAENREYPLDKYLAEKTAEIADDDHGIYVAAILRSKIDGKKTAVLARVDLLNLLCDSVLNPPNPK